MTIKIKDLMITEAFTAIPGIISPKELQMQHQASLQGSLIIFFKKIHESIGLNLESLIEKFTAIDLEKKFSPYIFVTYEHLRSSYIKKDLQGIFDALFTFTKMNEDDIYSFKRRYGSILEDSWEKEIISDLRNFTTHDDEGRRLDKPIQMLPLFHWKASDYPPKEFQEAEELVCELDKDLWEEYQTYVANIKLFLGKSLESLTSSQTFGTLFIRLPNPEEEACIYYFDKIVHETSHLQLYIMMGEDPLVLNQPCELFSSPLRVDKRPMTGIYHAVFVLARLVRLFRRLEKKRPNDEEIQASARKYEKLFEEGVNTLQEHAKFTSRGREIYETLFACAYK